MDIAGLLVQAVAGALAGQGAGMLSKGTSLGTAGNSIAGGIGGVLLSQVLPMLMGNTAVAATGLDMTTIISGFITGGIGGGVTALVVGFIKAKMAK